MGNGIYQAFTTKADKYMRIIFAILLVAGSFGTFAMGQGCAGSSTCGSYGSSNSANSIVCNTYQLYNSIDTVIFIIGLTLMILGGALYAASHIMPGQSKGTIQGYGMGMVLGGVIGIVIAVLAPYIFSLISSTNFVAYVFNPPPSGAFKSGYVQAPNPEGSPPKCSAGSGCPYIAYSCP